MKKTGVFYLGGNIEPDFTPHLKCKAGFICTRYISSGGYPIMKKNHLGPRNSTRVRQVRALAHTQLQTSSGYGPSCRPDEALIAKPECLLPTQFKI